MFIYTTIHNLIEIKQDQTGKKTNTILYKQNCHWYATRLISSLNGIFKYLNLMGISKRNFIRLVPFQYRNDPTNSF